MLEHPPEADAIIATAATRNSVFGAIPNDMKPSVSARQTHRRAGRTRESVYMSKARVPSESANRIKG